MATIVPEAGQHLSAGATGAAKRVATMQSYHMRGVRSPITLETLLRRQGYAVWMAADAQEAFTWLREGAFDLLLLDLKLPDGVSGLDIAEGARVFQPDVAVLILTGSTLLEDIVGDSSRPHFETMFKTASPQDILDRVAALIAQHALHRQ